MFCSRGKKVYLFGGQYQNKIYNDLWCFDLSSSTWSFISTSNPPQARCGHKMVYADKKIYIFGGEALLQSTTKYNDLWVYDLQTKSFTDITPTAPATKPSARAHFGMAKFPELNQILIFGGHGNNYLNDLWFLNYISTTFAQSNPANSPSARDKFCFIKLKDKFFLYGGTSGYAALDDSYFFYYSTYRETTSQGIMISSQNPTKLCYRYFQFSPPPPANADVKFQIAYSSNGINYSQFLVPDGTT